jgi:exodeoxyribonuclease-3
VKIISWNVNGIRAVFKKNFLEWFNGENADIVCVQETKAEKEQFPNELAEIKGYNFYCVSAQKKGYSGVAVWAKIKPLTVSAGIENEKFDCEGRVLKLEFEKFILFNIYFPNGGASRERLEYKLEFYDYLLEYLKKYQDKTVIVCGDYNTAHREIDLARPKQNENVSGFLAVEREKLDELENIGFIDSFRHFNGEAGNYTWWDYKTAARSRNIGWRIDYFYISQNAAKHLKSADILNSAQGSDHCPVSITIY